MKKTLALLLSLMVVFLAACGNQTAETSSAADEKVSIEETSSTAGNSVSSNDTSASSSESGEYNLDEVEERNYTMAHCSSLDSIHEYWGNLLNETVQKKSGGKMHIDVYGASQMGNETSIATDTVAGAIDFQLSTTSQLTSVVPNCAVFDMPFIFKDLTSARKVLLDDALFEDLQKSFADAGLYLFPLSDQSFRNITTNRNITKFEDLKGMSIRTMSNETHIKFFNALGCAATPLNVSELFIALQQGMLEAEENPWSQIYDKGLYDVQKYVTNSQHILYVTTLEMGMDNWNSLSPTEQQIFLDAVNETIPTVEEYVDEVDEKSLGLLLDKGMTYIDFDQIDNMRESCLDATFDVAYNSIKDQIGTELLDNLLTAAGYADRIPK